ncbi:hypothetical protein PR202_ga26727 [Eleusine coracana subsp. coracana]|uniref:serine--tRNA ligase n=1 Tax=Eleusine coracana subsp. coracana TaxID=191504 RepID=A0AAV5DF83_ELECO|nr:hypothetical protein PR202_ga26727 [Eleusine coracana subsp. coracana]
MLDINLLRVDKGGNPDLVRESQRNRFANVELVDEIIALDQAWRARQFELDKIRQELNATSKKIGKLKASKQEEEAKKLMESTDEIKKRLAAKDAEVQEAKGTLDAKLMTIGNIVHASVPISDDEVTGDGEDKYLIATSEQPLCAYHLGDRIYPAELPIRYAGYSTCFRKEAGSHGRDTAGIFRVHQFEKIEQFCVTSPNGNDSWEMHEEMLKNSEDFYKENDEQSKQFVHMLNSTLTATERTLCCILENYQREDGVEVPKALQPYMCGIEFIPFKQPLDTKQAADSKSNKSKAKGNAP